MIHVAIGFMKAMGTLRKPWWVWIGLLMLVNLVLPLVFLSALEARVVLAAFFMAAGLQMVIFWRKGFVRLLGIGHVPWVPMSLWLSSRLPLIGTESPFGKWVLALLVLNGLSLAIDFLDVVRYVLGDRRATYRLEPSLKSPDSSFIN